MNDNNSNLTNQLPIEFKCFWKGVHVGFEFHELGFHDLLEKHYKTWFYEPGQEEGEWKKNPPFEVDEKRQYTGFQDRNGNKIYFGDKLRIPEDNLLFTVVLEDGRIFAVRTGTSPGFGANSFQYMEKKGNEDKI